MDEPHTGLDQDACEMLNNVLRQVAQQGRTVVMASHDLERALDLATRFDVISHGVISASTRLQDLPPQGLLFYYRQALGLEQ
jgi:heme exporter protein A